MSEIHGEIDLVEPAIATCRTCSKRWSGLPTISAALLALNLHYTTAHNGHGDTLVVEFT